jgi:hypothetical protein
MQPKSTEPTPSSKWAWNWDMERGVTIVTLPHWAAVLGVFLALVGAVSAVKDVYAALIITF